MSFLLTHSVRSVGSAGNFVCAVILLLSNISVSSTVNPLKVAIFLLYSKNSSVTSLCLTNEGHNIKYVRDTVVAQVKFFHERSIFSNNRWLNLGQITKCERKAAGRSHRLPARFPLYICLFRQQVLGRSVLSSPKLRSSPSSLLKECCNISKKKWFFCNGVGGFLSHLYPRSCNNTVLAARW